MLGPNLDHVWTMFCLTLVPDQLELWNLRTESTCSKAFNHLMSILRGHVRARLGLCLSLPNIQTSWSSKNFQTVSLFSKAHVYGENSFWTISIQCLGHAWTMFGLALLPDKPELWIFQDQLILSRENVYGVFTFLDPVRAVFGPCCDYIWPGITPRLAGA